MTSLESSLLLNCICILIVHYHSHWILFVSMVQLGHGLGKWKFMQIYRSLNSSRNFAIMSQTVGKYDIFVEVHDFYFKNILKHFTDSTSQSYNPDFFFLGGGWSSIIKTQTLPASQAQECHLELAITEVKSRGRAGETEATYLYGSPVPPTLLKRLQVLSEACYLWQLWSLERWSKQRNKIMI